MTAFLVDEMFPASAAVLLRDTYGYNAVHVAEIGLRGADDAHVAAVARAEGYASNGDHVIVCAGVPFKRPGTTNMLRIFKIGETH